MPKKFLDKIVDKIVKSGEKIANIVAVILISTGINLLTGLATSSIKDLNSTYHLFLGSLFFLCGGILSFLFGARIKDAYEEANRIFIYSAIDRVVNSISYLAIKAMKRNDKKAKINRLFVFFIIVSIIGGIFSLFSKFFFSINMQFILNSVI